MAIAGTSADALKAEFATWYFDPERTGTHKQWAEEHGVHPSTLSAWKTEEWFQNIAQQWQEQYGKMWPVVIQALFKRATNTDDFNNQQVAAAKLLGELLGKIGPKKSEGEKFAETLAGLLMGAKPVTPELPEGNVVEMPVKRVAS